MYYKNVYCSHCGRKSAELALGLCLRCRENEARLHAMPASEQLAELAAFEKLHKSKYKIVTYPCEICGVENTNRFRCSACNDNYKFNEKNDIYTGFAGQVVGGLIK